MGRVVVTGLGLLTPLGNDVASTWDGLVAGRSGIGHITAFDASEYEFPIAGELKDFRADAVLDAKLARRVDRAPVLAVAAARQAVADSCLDLAAEDPAAVGIVIGTGIGGAHLLIDNYQVLTERGARRVSPFLITQMLPDTATGLIAIELGARGPNMAVSAACATGGAALGEAAEMIARGDADVIVAGGFEAPIRPIYYAGFEAMRALAHHPDPQRAARPFDAERNGFVISEGAGIMVLESLDHALARRAHIYGEWLGAGSSNDAVDMVAAAEDGRGIAIAIEKALRRSGVEREQIDYINAHGPGTPLGDRVETRGIRAVFREHADRLMVSSTKSMLGHMMGGAGAVEGIVALLACERGIVPPTINYEHPDPACDLDYVPNEARVAAVRYAMSTSVGLGGHNSAIIFGRWEGK
ncbi:MAG: beta-ketoacyl-[acyl-carrier-protein] synthase II [Dehalococcoidia bacterium]|nr:beta-ketoacyl-[acyl-carrier-protein] synthase II [Dehalococcoidia bacterium]